MFYLLDDDVLRYLIMWNLYLTIFKQTTFLMRFEHQLTQD